VNRDAECATTALERKRLASSPLVEAEIAAWFDAETPENETAAAPWLNKAALDHGLCAARLIPASRRLSQEPIRGGARADADRKSLDRLG
jgi:hypothetical protein